MRFCLMIEGQEGVTWQEWRALATTAEELGFEALFTSDHYLSVLGNRERGSSDAWTNLGALAASTSTIRLGTLVSPVTFRHPAVLAKAAVTVDRISGGRAEIGMGAGWWREEHATHGFDFPPVQERFQELEEQLQVVHGLLSQDGWSFSGKRYHLEDANFAPKSVQRPHPPLILGGTTAGPWMQRLVASYADEFNTVGGTPAEVRARFDRIRSGVSSAGRDPSSLTTSFMTWCYVGETRDAWLDRVRRAREKNMRAGKFEDEIAELQRDCIVGTPEEAAERLSGYAEAGVQRVMLNHELFDDLDMLRLLATEVFPAVEG
jgi:F420-dependent oxidoreductase-like protein